MTILTSRDSNISIHALREEGDFSIVEFCPLCDTFLSTPSARRATLLRSAILPRSRDFYPRPPRGGRRNTAYQRGMADIFLSTPSARRATIQQQHMRASRTISIHALREEGDNRRLCTHPEPSGYFYPRPPRGGRPGIHLVVLFMK